MRTARGPTCYAIKVTSREVESTLDAEPPDLGLAEGAAATYAATNRGRRQRIGRFLVLGRLGHGAMGVVVEAHDEHLDRTVALKLLHPAATKHHQERLLREAKALARLSHPNVVQVYDVGTMGDHTFIAMELVRGDTLAQHRGSGSWRRAVNLYLQAARGLAAAHAKGLVHRDFKPENCMVGEDGRVRVVDFGLACDVSATRVAPSIIEEPEEPWDSVADLSQRITREGAVVGTVAYMAPEQFGGDVADESSDQYSFFVSLHEAICGGRREQSLGALVMERLQEDPKLSPDLDVPRRLRQALLRGLALQPGDRWPSMGAVITELEAIVRRRRWRSIATMLGVGAIAGGSLTAVSGSGPCPGAEVVRERVWDDTGRQQLADVFMRHRPEDVDVLLPRITDRIDGYARDWAEMTQQSCVDTFVGHHQSERSFELRARCLERRGNRLELALTSLTSAADPETLVQRSVLPFKLPLLTSCADVDALDERASVANEPEDDGTRAALRRRIDHAQTLRQSGEFEQALVIANAVVQEAAELDGVQLHGEALECQGRIEAEGGSMQEARKTLAGAIVEASRASDDSTVARAWVSLLYATTMTGDHDEAEHGVLPATAAVARAHDELLRAWLLNARGILAAEQGRYDDAQAHLEQALALKVSILGERHMDVGIAWLNLGSMLASADLYKAAREPIMKARSIFEGTVGSAHPMIAYTLTGQCNVEQGLGNSEAAIDLCELALERFARSLPGSMWESRTRFSLATALLSSQRPVEAGQMAQHAARLVSSENPAYSDKIDSWLEANELLHKEGD